MLIGMQLSTILRDTSGQSLAQLTALAGVVSLVVIVVRLVWVFLGWAIRKVFARASQRAPQAVAGALETFVVGWAGMRGVVSLATALALPLSLEGRNPALFVTFGVILVTLVGQGMTLPVVIRRLHVGVEGVPEGREDELRARTVAAEAALTRIDELAEEWPGHLPLINALRAQYEHRTTHLSELVPPADGTADSGSNPGSAAAAAEQELIEHQKIRRAVIDAQRAAVLEMRTLGTIDDQAWRKVQFDLDLEELRMEA